MSDYWENRRRAIEDGARYGGVAGMKEQKYMMSIRNPERLEDMRVFLGTFDEIAKAIEAEIPWPQSELWIEALKERTKQDHVKVGS